MVERQTMKFLPTKLYHIVWRSHTYCTTTTKIFHELAKNSLLTKILSPEKYPLYGISQCVCWLSSVLTWSQRHTEVQR